MYGGFDYNNIFHSLYGVGLCRLRKAVFVAVRYELYDRNADFGNSNSCLHGCGRILLPLPPTLSSIIMTVAIVFVLIYATVSAGGVSAVAENAKQLPGYLSFVSSYSETTGASEPYNLLHIITTLSWGLGYFGMPHILLRFMAIEDEKSLNSQEELRLFGSL